ncbi:MAG: mechanosensitive ion channel family protein [Ruminococcus sp.]|nr:mechanosensitive ion channel family protein [Ruminococcus sp.]
MYKLAFDFSDIFNSDMFWRIFKSSMVLLGAFIIWEVFKNVYTKTAAKREKVDNLEGVTGSFTSAVLGGAKIVLVIFSLLIILELNGINVTSLITGLGIAGAIAGLALQDFIKDTIMGLRIISDNFYRVGDVVKYNGVEGIVIEFSLRSTRIRSIDTHDELTISNRNIDQITKRSHLYDLDIPLSYDEDFKRINKIFEEMSHEIARIDGVESCEYKGTQFFTESAVKYRLRIFCMPERRPELHRASIRLIQDRLDRENIRIPYNQLDIHNISGS